MSLLILISERLEAHQALGDPLVESVETILRHGAIARVVGWARIRVCASRQKTCKVETEHQRTRAFGGVGRACLAYQLGDKLAHRETCQLVTTPSAP